MGKKSKIDPKDLMAVERATTALIGTAISLIILGFVVEKFELFLYAISTELASNKTNLKPLVEHLPLYHYLGIGIVIAGILLAILLALYTYRYYTVWIKHLENAEIDTDKNIYFLLALFIAFVGLILLISMFSF